jgi:hypothetical protein
MAATSTNGASWRNTQVTTRSLTALLVVQTLLIAALVVMVGLPLLGIRVGAAAATGTTAADGSYCQAFRAANEEVDVPGGFDFRQFYERLPPVKGLGGAGGNDPDQIGCPPGYIMQH